MQRSPKLVKDLKELDKYLWTGHSALLGKRKNALIPDVPLINDGENNDKFLAEKTVEDVLRYFGDSLRVARTNYRRFVEKGIMHGRREDLQGGGLIRPACHARPENIWKEQVVGIVHMVEEASREVRHERAGAVGVTRQGC